MGMVSRLWFRAAVLPLLVGCAGQPAERSRLPEPTTAPIKRVQQVNRPVVALALGSGGARGFAHVGVIKAIEAAGIHPDGVVGVSSGAVVAALYASVRAHGRATQGDREPSG